MSDTKEMPRYKCHKEVHALKIEKLEPKGDGSFLLTPAEEGFAPFEVSKDFVDKHHPEVGGYYVVYEDGYTSYSPASAFESGYTLL